MHRQGVKGTVARFRRRFIELKSRDHRNMIQAAAVITVVA
jgi:hypothetical protein